MPRPPRKFETFCDDLEALGRAFDDGATTDQLLTRIRDDIGLGAALGDTRPLRQGARRESPRRPQRPHRGRHLRARRRPRSNPGCAPACAAANEPAGGDGVAVSTVHRVKGMEWPYVVVLGAHDGLMPHALADDIEEERRIFHVAITRGDTAVHVVADATARRPFLDQLLAPAPPPRTVRSA